MANLPDKPVSWYKGYRINYADGDQEHFVYPWAVCSRKACDKRPSVMAVLPLSAGEYAKAYPSDAAHDYIPNVEQFEGADAASRTSSAGSRSMV